ncbi:hypothetical protein BH23PAT1_BH23PAT1_3450 [soil metagenome]
MCNMKKLMSDEKGLVPLLLLVLIVMLAAIIFAYLRVQGAD